MNASARAALTRIASGQLPLLGSAAPARMGRPVVTHRTAHEKARRWGLEPARRAFRQRDKSVMVCQGPHRKACCFRLRREARDCFLSTADGGSIRCIGYSRRMLANPCPGHPGDFTVPSRRRQTKRKYSIRRPTRIARANRRAQPARCRHRLLPRTEQPPGASVSYIEIRIKTPDFRVDQVF